jgi:uncharacterized membrane protein YhaH (DUF805 family)
MRLKDKLFSFEGRIRRLDFWLWGILLWIIHLVGQLGIRAALLNHPEPLFGGRNAAAIASSVLVVLFMWPALALGFKRAHDRNRSGWWVVASYALILADHVPVSRTKHAADQFHMLSVALMIVIGFWFLIDLGLLDGTPGPNRFGPAPKPVEGEAAPA